MDSPLRLCTICARGGSQGVKNKNLRVVAGKPLLAHSIQHALQSRLFYTVGVSSDSPEILDCAKRSGADQLIQRPAQLAQHDSPKIPAIRHCVSEIERLSGKAFATVVDLDTTSPLRSVVDITEAVKMLEDSDASNVITGAPARRSPYFNLVECDRDGRVRLSKQPAGSVSRRQDAPACFDMNASIYVWRREALFSMPSLFGPLTRLYVMPEERSLDIDSELDLEIVQYLMEKRGGGL